MNVVELKDIRGRGRGIVRPPRVPGNGARARRGRNALVGEARGPTPPSRTVHCGEMTQDASQSRSLGRSAVQRAAQWLKPLKLARFPWVRRVYHAVYRRAVPAGRLVEVGLFGSRFLVD